MRYISISLRRGLVVSRLEMQGELASVVGTSGV